MPETPTDRDGLLARITDALERLSPAPAAKPDWLAAPAYVWNREGARPIAALEAPALDLLRGIDEQKHIVCTNIARLAAGHAAHDMLLWGARGMGKSALVRAAVIEAQSKGGSSLALVQAGSGALETLPRLLALLGAEERRFLLYIDDLGFADGDMHGPRRLRSWLEGGVEARPDNVRLAVTSNRRALLPRQASEQGDPLNPRDAVDDKLALADRFGITLGFHNCNEATYLDIVRGYTERYGLEWDAAEAAQWARQRGAMSGRTAWQFVTELAGRDGKSL